MRMSACYTESAVTTNINMYVSLPRHSCFYSVDKLMPELLRQSPYYTNNASEADYFYVR